MEKEKTLEEQLNLCPIDIYAEFEKDPKVWRLKQVITKSNQTSEMVWKAIKYDDNPHDPILSVISKKLITPEIYYAALEKDGHNILFVPNNLITYDMCKLAVCHDLSRHYNECILGFFSDILGTHEPDKKFTGKVKKAVSYQINGHEKELCELAVAHNGLAIAFVPKKYITENMIYKAIDLQTENYYGDYPIGYIPEEYMSDDLVKHSVELCPASLQSVPYEYISNDLCEGVVKRNGLFLKYIPNKFKTRSIIDLALESSPLALEFVPEDKRTKKRCLCALKHNPDIPKKWIPEKFHLELFTSDKSDIDLQEKSNSHVLVKEEPLTLPLPDMIPENALPSSETGGAIIYSFSVDEHINKTIYYISDIHLEHQLDLQNQNYDTVNNMISEKVQELVNSVDDKTGLLLIGGDVADSIELVQIFYSILKKYWQGQIIAILGNHELWDGKPLGTKSPRPVDTIIDDYKQALSANYIIFLENALLIQHKGYRWRALDESMILNATNDELFKLCSESSCIILGGLGFSGLDPYFNANLGLYRSTISIIEDQERSERFHKIYQKVLECVSSQQVIVLTHTPVNNWLSDDCNPNWIYINGHTHRNCSIRMENGTTILSDNQIGYSPQKWSLHGFTVSGIYDPFNDWADGIYEITAEQYTEFNEGRSISCTFTRNTGQIIMLKRSDIYMFLYTNNSRLYWLNGGQINKASHETQYYWDNMLIYYNRIRKMYNPYYSVLNKISKEVKLIGGYGDIHGCIVDIDFFNHIYLNPFDGKMTPYFATDTIHKIAFHDLLQLLSFRKESEQLLQNYELCCNKHQLSLLLPFKAKIQSNVTTAPTLTLDTNIYRSSRTMRSLQFIEQNVLRIWKDEVLDTNFDKRYALEPNI